jgi:hypothetical protein
MMKACIHELMQLSAGPEPKDKNLKKTTNPLGADSNSQGVSTRQKDSEFCHYPLLTRVDLFYKDAAYL